MKRVLILILLSGASWAQDAPKKAPEQPQALGALWDRGNDFMRTCAETPDRSVQGAACVAYIMGVWDGFFFGKPGQAYCISDDATPLQLKRIVVKYISDHPEKAHKPSLELVIFAINEAFPCPSATK